MPDALDQEIRTWIARYLRGGVSLDAFERWFTPATWDVESTGDAAAQGLAAVVALKLAEFSHGDLSVDELREEFRPLVGMIAEEPETELSTSGASTLTRHQGSFAAGTARSVVYG